MRSATQDFIEQQLEQGVRDELIIDDLQKQGYSYDEAEDLLDQIRLDASLAAANLSREPSLLERAKEQLQTPHILMFVIAIALMLTTAALFLTLFS